MRLAAYSTAALLAFLAPACALAQGASDVAAARNIAAAYNVTGDGLMRQLATEPGNIVFSPASIGLAMSMALHGARDATADEMRRVLSLTPERVGAMSSGESKLISILNGYDKSTAPVTCPSSAMRVGDKCAVPIGTNGRCGPRAKMKKDLCLTEGLRPASAQLLIANALMLTPKGDDVSRDYTADLMRDYGAEVFRNVNAGRINDWVKKKTEGRIEKILDNLDPNSYAVILNAVYFRARWNEAFSKSATRETPFRLTPSESAPVSTMHKSARFAVVDGDDYRAIRLPYTVGELGMVIVLPNAVDGANAIDAKLNTPAFAKLTADLMNVSAIKPVDLSLPKFKIAYGASLIPVFRALGLALPFGLKANFSGVTTGKPPSELPLYISDIEHRAMIDVEEEETEATAATTVTLAIRSVAVREEPRVFRVDRPFLFYITDDVTGAILFRGRINDPRKS